MAIINSEKFQYLLTLIENLPKTVLGDHQEQIDVFYNLPPEFIRTVFLFYSKLEILPFLVYNPQYVSFSSYNAFVTLGVLPTFYKLQLVRNYFPNARLIGVFDNSLSGKILDCKVAVWVNKHTINCVLSDDHIIVLYKDVSYTIPAEKFSLNQFKCCSGFRSNYRTIKPKNYRCFSDMT